MNKKRKEKEQEKKRMMNNISKCFLQHVRSTQEKNQDQYQLTLLNFCTSYSASI